MRSSRRRYVRRMPKIYGNLQPRERQLSFTWVSTLVRRLGLWGVVGAVLYYAVAGSIFRVKEVDVRGARLVEPTAIADMVPRGGNIWTFSKGGLADAIRANPVVEEVRVLRGLPGTIRVELVERSAAALWVIGTTGYVLDNDGIAFLEYNLDQLPAEDSVVGQTLRSLPRIADQSGLTTALGEQPASGLFLSFVSSVQEQMDLLLPGYELERYEVGTTTYDVTLVLRNGPRIFLNSLGDPGVQVRNVARLVRDGKLEGAQSVDLRVDRWAYVR